MQAKFLSTKLVSSLHYFTLELCYSKIAPDLLRGTLQVAKAYNKTHFHSFLRRRRNPGPEYLSPLNTILPNRTAVFPHLLRSFSSSLSAGEKHPYIIIWKCNVM